MTKKGQSCLFYEPLNQSNFCGTLDLAAALGKMNGQNHFAYVTRCHSLHRSMGGFAPRETFAARQADGLRRNKAGSPNLVDKR